MIFSWHVFNQPSWGSWHSAGKKTYPGPPIALRILDTGKNLLLIRAGRSCLVHSAPRTWQVQELPSYHWIPLANQVAFGHRFRFNVPSYKRNQSKSHTPDHTLLSFQHQHAWRVELIFRVLEIHFPRNPISRPSHHPAETIICILVVTNFHFKGQKLIWLSSNWARRVLVSRCPSRLLCSPQLLQSGDPNSSPSASQPRSQGLLSSN